MEACATFAWQQGDCDTAEALYREGLTLSRAAGLVGFSAHMLQGLGRVAIERGHYQQAVAPLTESLELMRQVGDPGGIAGTLFQLADVALAQEEYPRARAWCEEGLRLCPPTTPTYWTPLLLHVLQ